jgi:dTDP-4-amino-4,6-dideoxygalactose transaminase
MRRVAPETNTAVPFLDLRALHAGIVDDVLADFADIIESSSFVNGKHVALFEEQFASAVGVSHCVGLASGLDALRLALTAMDIQPGAEVIVPAMTFVATWEAVSQVGAVPVPVDVSEVDYTLDVERTEAAVGGRTGAIMPVHLYGQMADMEGMLAISDRHDVPVIEDAAQAHGSERGDRRAGATGVAAGFSFYPGKNLGAMGDAGALVTNDARIAARVRALREHGQSRKYHHDEIGWTARLDTIQAAVLLRKLPALSAGNQARGDAAILYSEALTGIGDLVLPRSAPASRHVWHLYVIRTADPLGLGRHLAEQGISTGRHYPVPLHLTDAYASLGYSRGAFPVAERLGEECLSLPIFPGITENQIATVVDAVRSWFDG